LIHLEQTFDENLFTLRGRRAHERADEAMDRIEDGVRVVRAMPIWSDRLGLIGRADIVEFHGAVPYPVEYKVGKRRNWEHEALQLCAQGMCLEEMVGVAAPAGAIFYHGSRQRREVDFDGQLRARVEEAVIAVRTMMNGTRLPPAPNDRRCPDCAQFEACLPSVVGNPARIRGFQGELFHPGED
jgi:CRISPR-associated exonuclease Cas4